jgi:DNA-binding transcriptional LysR family regulator
MEITRLRYFCALAETESVRRAAELLHVSPGALSKALAQTEEIAGQPLFARVGRTIALTDAGRRFHAQAMKVIADYDALTAPAAATPAALRIGSFEVFTTHLLGHVVAKMPGDLVALELTPGKMEQAVSDGTVDFGITYAPVAMPGIEFIAVGELKMGIFGQPGRWSAADPFDTWPFAVPVTSVGGHVAGFQSLDGWPADAPPRLIRYRCEMLETALVLARNGVAVLHCPTFVVRLSNKGAKVPLQAVALPKKMKPVTATVYLVKRAAEAETPRLKAWARELHSVIRE